MINTDTQTQPHEKKIKIDRMYEYALKIQAGEAGGQYLYCMEDDKFYSYHDGYWEAIHFIDFMGRIEEGLPEIIERPVNQRNNIGENYKRIARKKLEEFNKDEFINLKNCMLSPIEFKTYSHSPDFYSTNRLPYDYQPSCDCPLWKKTLEEILEKDKLKIGILQEFFGYCLTRDTKQHKALLLLGESRSGKSTILHILKHLVGERNCASVPLCDIRNQQHTPSLINKLLDIDYDVSSKAVEFEAEFKKITGGEPIRTNQKYIEAFDFVPYCKLAMAANIFPKITDHSSAFYNRLLLIPCDRVFTPEEQNRDLPQQLLRELSGILNWALEGLRRLNHRGRFEDLDFMREAVEELENENNPVNLFFEEFIKTESGTYIEKGELFEYYKRWAEEAHHYTLSKARFASCLYKKYYRNTTKNARLPNGGKRIWTNIKYIGNGEHKGESVQWQE